MNFKYDGLSYQGSRAEIIEQLRNTLVLTIKNGLICLGLEKYPIFEEMNLDQAREILLLRIQKQVPGERRVKIDGDDIIIIINGAKKRVNIYDL